MAQPLKILLVEDNPDDAGLVERELCRSGFEPQIRRVDTEADFRRQLDGEFDLILSDFHLPGFTGLQALALLKARPELETPFILVSGTLGEETAVQAIKLGATDYIIKDRLARLGSAVVRALGEGASRREAAKAEQARRLFRLLTEESIDTLEVVEPATGRYLDVNLAGPRELGCTREEYLALRVCDVETSVTAATWPDMVRRIREAGSIRGEGTHRRKDGTEFPTEYNAKWVRLDRDYIVAVIRDISLRRRAEQDLRESEERFRQLAENIHEVFWIVNAAKDQMLYVSPAYEAIWGRTCASLYAAPRNWIEAIHSDDRHRVELAWTEPSGDGTYEAEYRIVRQDGTERWIRDRGFPVRNAAGEIERMVGLAEDVTESKRLNEQFLRAQRMEAIGTLAGGIAHDLNNILAPMLMAPELLRPSIVRENDRRMLDLIEQSARRGANVIRQLLTFSRGMGGERVPLQLRHLIKEMTGIMRETFPRDIEVAESIASELLPVVGDPTQLHQVLMNLCVNARDAMPGGGRLKVAAKNVELTEAEVRIHAPSPPGFYATISVTDSGHGIPTEIITRIFDPFFTTKPPSQGTGLGLSTVLGIARSHNGFVTVESAPGRGTAFTVYLPATQSAAGSTVAVAGSALPVGGGESILLVDDEAAIRTALRLILERQNYAVFTAGDGAEALAIFLKQPEVIRLVLTDLMMPVMGGSNLIRALREVSPTLPIIAISGVTDQANHVELTDLGVNQILEKPCGPAQLLEAIRTQMAPRDPR